MSSKDTILPVILSGGSGARLWPLSRKAYPKQFLELFGRESLFQQTCKRVGSELFSAPLVVSNNDHRFIVAEQMQLMGVTPENIVLEPVGRNTAPAILIAALLAARKDKHTLLLILPSDHVIEDHSGFCEAVSLGIEDAKGGNIITFGKKPDSPHTGYGYIETKGSEKSVCDVVSFVEKPSLETAKKYLSSGNYFWNAGIFLFSAQTMIDAFKAYAPEILQHCEKALELSTIDLDFLRLDEEAFAQCTDISIDYAILEKTSAIRCVPFTASWSDLGSWSAIAEQVDDLDELGNGAYGDILFHQSRNCFGYSSDGADISMVGMEDTIVVATKDSILVTSKSASQEVKQVVDLRRESNPDSVEYHTRVRRPWGWYEGIERGERFQVKCLMVKPGGRLSLQSHHHRSEHWVVVSGTAKVTVDEKTTLLSENESTYIPLGAKHRLENPGKLPALLIEVQSGSYLGEDDIVRYEDVYGRS